MLKKIQSGFIVLFVLQLTFLQINITAKNPTAKIKIPKNVILMIGDGMGFNHIKATDYYQYGEEGKQVYENFPVKYAVSTYPAKTGSYGKEQPWALGYNPSEAWKNFEYLKTGYTESAGAATALATGKKSYNNAIGMDLDSKTKLTNLSEDAKKLGKSTGVVTTVEFYDATPSCFIAHNATRKNGSEIVQEMILDSKADVIIGIGNPLFDENGKPVEEKDIKFKGGNELWNQLAAKPATKFIIDKKEKTVQDIDGDDKPDAWTLIQDKADFQKYMKGNTPKRLLGLPKVAGTLQESRGGDVNALPYAAPLNANVPTLTEMGLTAINVLSKNKAGFFVMIEGGAIDHASHNNRKGRMIEELIDFNKAIESVVNWIETNSSWDETLLIITADHETGLVWGPAKGTFDTLVNNGKNNLPGFEFNSGNHSNSLVALFAKGAGSELFNLFADQVDPVRGRFLNNTAIPNIIKTLYRFDPKWRD